MVRLVRRPGLTIIEVLVVVAIIGILVALLLPAVQSAREAARRMQCTNRLRQLALACHLYHDVHSTLPPAWLTKPGYGSLNASSQYSLWGWAALLLPFVEQEPLFTQLSVGDVHLHQAAVTGSATLCLMQQPLTGFRCPSDVAPDTNALRAYYPFGVAANSLATSNFVASNSSFDINPYPDGVRQGVFIEDRGRRLTDITDGTSVSLLLGERRWNVTRINGQLNIVGAAVVYGTSCRDYPGTRADVAACGRPRLNCNGIDERGGNNWARRGFSSQHAHGANFAMCDGSVRFIGESVEHDSGGNLYQRSDNFDPDTVYERLIGIFDGNPVEHF